MKSTTTSRQQSINFASTEKMSLSFDNGEGLEVAGKVNFMLEHCKVVTL